MNLTRKIVDFSMIFVSYLLFIFFFFWLRVSYLLFYFCCQPMCISQRNGNKVALRAKNKFSQLPSIFSLPSMSRTMKFFLCSFYLSHYLSPFVHSRPALKNCFFFILFINQEAVCGCAALLGFTRWLQVVVEFEIKNVKQGK